MAIEDVRRDYAKRIGEASGAKLPGLVEAFATVPRESFLGPGPWRLASPFPSQHGPHVGYWESPDANPEHVYQDVLVAIDPERQLNNGHPSSHALWIAAAAPRPGNAVLHIGCGTGYYSAIFAELVGGAGRVVAVEIDPGLAERARAVLARWPQVHVQVGDGSRAQGPEGANGGPYDVIYVNAGATHAPPTWLASLAEGGRLLLPLTVHRSRRSGRHGVGVVIVAVRTAVSSQPWPVRVVSSVAIFDCHGARDVRAEKQLRALLKASATDDLHALRTDPHDKTGDCLIHLEGFCLQR